MNATVSQLADEFHRQGYVIVPSLFTPEEVAEIRETFMSQNEGGPVPGLSEIGRNIAGEDHSDPLVFYPRMMHPHKHPRQARWAALDALHA